MAGLDVRVLAPDTDGATMDSVTPKPMRGGFVEA
jgi:hypothetical protein